MTSGMSLYVVKAKDRKGSLWLAAHWAHGCVHSECVPFFYAAEELAWAARALSLEPERWDVCIVEDLVVRSLTRSTCPAHDAAAI